MEMVWEKLEGKPLFDISVHRGRIRISEKSELWNLMKMNKYRFDVYIDRENRRIAIVPNSDGDYSWYNPAKNFTEKSIVYVAFMEYLGIGRYRGKIEEIDGKSGMVFGREVK